MEPDGAHSLDEGNGRTFLIWMAGVDLMEPDGAHSLDEGGRVTVGPS